MPVPTVDSVCAKFDTARKELGEILVDRDEEIELALTALLAALSVAFAAFTGPGRSIARRVKLAAVTTVIR